MRGRKVKGTPPPPVKLKPRIEYCLPCGIAGRDVAATTTVDDDPMCGPCAHAALTPVLGNSAAGELERGGVELASNHDAEETA